MSTLRRGARRCRVLVLVLVLASCATDPGVDRSSNIHASERHFTADPATAAPGTLLESSPDPTVDVRINRAHASATRIVYRSSDGVTGEPTIVTGMVFIPNAAPPPQGWLMVAFGHPVAGLASDCGPSRHSNLLGNGSSVESLLQEGYLVVMPDYQRSGVGGLPYLNPKTLGYNMIDGVRAARQLNPGAGDRWAAYGQREGGEAAWAAAQLAPDYGGDLILVGAAALNPTADVSALPFVALHGNLTSGQMLMMLYAANALSARSPDIRLDDYVHGYTRRSNDVLLACGDPDRRALAGSGMSTGDLRPVDDAAAQRMSELMSAEALNGGLGVARAPVLVMVGAEDRTVLPEWTAATVQGACARGERITFLSRVAEGHDDLHQRPALAWVANQFKGIVVDQFGGPSEGAQCNTS